MTKQTKILLGISGVGVLAYLLWKNSKKTADTTTTTTTKPDVSFPKGKEYLDKDVEIPEKGTGTAPSIGKYKFLKPHTVSFPIRFKEDPNGWGDGHKKFDTIESKSFTFKIGDIINSESSTFNPSSNVWDWDILLNISRKNDSLSFPIPKSILQKVDDFSFATKYYESDFPNPTYEPYIPDNYYGYNHPSYEYGGGTGYYDIEGIHYV